MNPDSKRLRDRFRQETYEAILTAARAEFATKGFGSARMEEIARTAGVSVGTVYNHFKDREALLSALLERQRDELIRRVDEALVQHENQPFEARLRAFIHALTDHFEAERSLIATYFEEELAGRRRSRKKVHTLREVVVRADALIRAGVREGALRADDSELFSSFLSGALRGLMARAVFTQDSRPFTESAEPIMRFFMDGARNRSRS